MNPRCLLKYKTKLGLNQGTLSKGMQEIQYNDFVATGCQNLFPIDNDTGYSHNMLEQLLDSVFGLSIKLGRVPFSTIVKRSTGIQK
jgi:hypothetical protein